MAEATLIRPLRSSDAEALFEAVRASAETVGRWLSWCRPDLTRADMTARVRALVQAWNAGEGFAFVLCDPAGGRVLGEVLLNHVNRIHRFANLAYWVRPGDTGRGRATKAVRRVARFGFAGAGLARVEIVVDPRNGASRRVAEKAGARYEGVLRHRLAHGALLSDGLMFSLVPEDFGLTPAPALRIPPRRPV